MASYEDQMEQAADGEFTVEMRRRKAQHDAEAAEKVAGPRARFSVRSWNDVDGNADHGTFVRYADAAAEFWQLVQLMPDDGWAQPTSGLTGAMRRTGRNFLAGDHCGAAWWIELEIER